VPPELGRALELQNELRAAAEGFKMREVQFREFLKVYKEFKAFPPILARIDGHVVRLNEENCDELSAFIMQWKLVALAAEVLTACCRGRHCVPIRRGRYTL
jgi:hypothetical protein